MCWHLRTSSEWEGPTRVGFTSMGKGGNMHPMYVAFSRVGEPAGKAPKLG